MTTADDDLPDTDSDDDSGAARPGVRLQKLLAAAGWGARRKCEELILSGRVKVDGQPVRELGVRVDSRAQRIEVDGQALKYSRKIAFAVNKPPGYLSTSDDPQGRPIVLDLLPEHSSRLFTIGRLDEHSEGLILVTNDGELAQRLAHPRYGVPKKYRVQVAGWPTVDDIESLKTGHHFSDGLFRVQHVKALKKQGKSTLLEIILTEGQNREIRRLLARIGHKVMRLERIAVGPIQLGRLPLGRFRPLSAVEIRSLYATAAGGAAVPSPGKSRPRRTRNPRSRA